MHEGSFEDWPRKSAQDLPAGTEKVEYDAIDDKKVEYDAIDDKNVEYDAIDDKKVDYDAIDDKKVEYDTIDEHQLFFPFAYGGRNLHLLNTQLFF